METRSDDQRYRLGEVLGKGALATVVALDGPDGRRRAGKILHESQSQDPDSVARFLQEAALLRRLDHPNLVQVIETVQVGGRPMLVMELVEGPTLAKRIAQAAPLGEAELLAIGRGIAAGLAHAHAAGVIHRDLKPGNILLARDARSTDDAASTSPSPSSTSSTNATPMTPKIGDFGMARASSLAGIEHQAMTVVGTPDYMAPESLDPLAVDLRSDLYALGCILYEMATGRPPYDAATPLGLLHQHRSAPIPTIPEGLSLGTRTLITELLAKSPGDRPQAAATVARRLAELAEGAPGRALARVDEAGRARCHTCGEPLLPGLALCLACGEATVTLGRGASMVMVVGPGAIGDKLDVQIRDRLCAWIRANPGLHLDAAPLAKNIPRVPFTLCRRVDQTGAEATVAALGRLGIEAVARRGGALGDRRMRKKAGTLSLRTMAILAASGGAFANKAIFVLPFAIVAAMIAGLYAAVRTTTKALPRAHAAIAPPIVNALVKVERVAPAIQAERHRHALRAVVLRVLALAEARGPGVQADPELAQELAQAVDAAVATAGRLDALDAELDRLDVRSASDEVRALLHERDTWSARLLQLTATLDAFQARLAGAQRSLAAADDDGDLDELRRRVEALEEIAKL
ncbi:MAG: serine/threonine-protein kinase [Nannocystaceae bacterium]